MRGLYVALVIGLLFLVAGAAAAQMNEMPADQQLQATVEPGPVVRQGLPASADVFVNERFALRVPASAGGMTPMERAQIIADRMNRAFQAGASWEDMMVAQVNGLWTVTIDGDVVATADVNSARAFGLNTGALANRWARQTVVALGGQPQMIAQQLEPIPGRVAGEVQELGVNWMITPVKSVPLLNAATGDQTGTITVAGAQDRLDTVQAVAWYQYSSEGAVIRTFVPITSTTVTDDLNRVMGVGVVQIPAPAFPLAGIRMGDEITQMTTQMGVQWNSLISTRLAANELALPSAVPTKVVPLYSLTMNEVVGAVQVVGDPDELAQTQSVALSNVDGNFALNATPTMPADITGQPRTLSDVLVSSVIFFPEEATITPPSPPGVPETTPPEPPETVP